MRRFVAYGLLGLGIEVAFTSIARAVRTRDLRLAGRTYLWMLPIYGAGGLFLERLHARLVRRGTPPPIRAIAATGAIFAIEYAAGSALRCAIGDCPWRYDRGATLRGYVRLDYAPYWYGAALLFELLQEEVRKLDRQRRLRDRRQMPAATAPAADESGAGPAAPAPERRLASRRRDDPRPWFPRSPRRARDGDCAGQAEAAPSGWPASA